MRKITTAAVATFFVLFTVILVFAVGTTVMLSSFISLGEFHGITLVALAVFLVYLYAFLLYRCFLAAMPLQTGKLLPGTRAEFSAQVNSMFYLMLFTTLISTRIIPIPIMRLVYLALGARLGRNTYSSGTLLDPPLTEIGDDSLIGHDAVLYCHVIEGNKFELHKIRIGSNVTIGATAVVMPDVEIGDGAIVSSGAVVTKGTRIGPGEIWGGVPARVIKRNDDLHTQEPLNESLTR